MKTPTVLLLALAALLVSVRADDRHDHDERNGGHGHGRVILFQHANFEGGALVVYPGDELDTFSGKTFDNGAKLNDGVSSIRVEGRAEVFLYGDSNFRGDALRLTEDVRDLSRRPVSDSVGATWNDRISSLRMARGDENDGHGGGRPGNRPPPVDAEKDIRRAFEDLLGRAPSAAEVREFRGRFVDSGWNERMLRDHLRTDRNYRSDVANHIIRRAYLDILGREPDPSGFNSYRKKVLDKNWTENDVRDDLRKSSEYRNRKH
jgi:hypothetical protein